MRKMLYIQILSINSNRLDKMDRDNQFLDQGKMSVTTYFLLA